MTNIEKEFDNLKQEIIYKANLGSQEATGFHAVHCPICKKTDRKTGGFKLEHDKIVYHCFRGSCDASTVLELAQPPSRKFRALMEAIDVEIPLELRMVKSSFQRQMETLNDDLFKKHYYKDVKKLPDFVSFDEGKQIYQDFWEDYFTTRATPFHDVLLCNEGVYKGCCALQMKYYDKTIGYQIITQRGDYIKQFDGNTNLVYIPESGYLPSGLDDTVLVVEGSLDAKCFPSTIAVMQSKISPEQAYVLRGKKNVIMIPDMDNTNHFIDQFHRYEGWSISIPDWGSDCKDLNDAVIKYGVIVVAELIMEGRTYDKYKAEVLYRMHR